MLDSVDITEYISFPMNITLTMNRFYNVAQGVIGDREIAESMLFKNIVIFYDTDTFTGFVYKVSKGSNLTWSFECRTMGAKLTEPFCPSSTTVDNATTASGLCALYSAETGVPITYNCEDLDFGGSYERNGTMLSALTQIVNVIGGEYYDDGTGIVIEPNKYIPETSDEILTRNDYFNFAKTENTVFNNGVGIVRISNGSFSGADILESNKIVMDIFDDGICHIYSSPKGEIESSVGISVELGIKTKTITETFSVQNLFKFTTKAPIKSISNMTLHGAKIGGYNFTDGYSTIYFVVPVSGTIEVEYEGYYQVGNPEYLLTPLGYFADIALRYLNQELLGSWYMTDTPASSGGIRVFTSSSPHVRKGYQVYMTGEGSPSLKVYADGEPFYGTASFSTVDYINRTTFSLGKSGSEYTYDINGLVSVSQVTSFGFAKPYSTTQADGKTTIHMSKNFPRLEVVYTESAMMAEVPSKSIEGEIVLVVTDHNADRLYEFDIANVDINDPSTIICAFGETVSVEIASNTDREIWEVAGKSLSVMEPDGTTVLKAIGADGRMKIVMEQNGKYIINTSSLTGRTNSTITVTITI